MIKKFTAAALGGAVLSMALASTALAGPLKVNAGDLSRNEALNLQCVSGSYLRDKPGDAIARLVQFPAAVDMPRQCLPEPCVRALSRPEFSALSGISRQHRIFEARWDEYYARYADHCRKETVPFPYTENGESEADEYAGGGGADAFWDPVLRPAVGFGGPGFALQGGGPTGKSAFVPYLPVGATPTADRLADPLPGFGGGGGLTYYEPVIAGDGEIGIPVWSIKDLTPVPAPASLPLLLAGLAAFLGLRRRA